MAKKNVFLTEDQIRYIKESKKVLRWNFDPKKVTVVIKYLDKGFKRGELEGLGEDGYPKKLKIVAMLSSKGTPLKNMTASQLFYLLQDRFQKMFSDHEQRDNFLWNVMNAWYEKKYDKNGILKKNRY